MHQPVTLIADRMQEAVAKLQKTKPTPIPFADEPLDELRNIRKLLDLDRIPEAKDRITRMLDWRLFEHWKRYV